MKKIFLIQGKKGDSVLIDTIIFLVLVGLFAAVMFIFSSKHKFGGAVIEGMYAKKIALALDLARPGTYIVVNLEEGAKVAEELNVEPAVFLDENYVVVKLTEGKGSKHPFFNDVDVELSYDARKKEVIILVK